MKHYNSIIAAALFSALSLNAQAQGWPASYGGVMLQGFYWDSYTDSKWTTLESQADELAEYFSLIWVPQSGNCGGTSMGYNPKYYFDQNSSFGTEAELRSMIKTFKAKGLGTIADVVINHRANVSSWVDFPRETYKGVTYEMVATDICKNDDGGATAKANPSVTLSANNDEGDDWSGMRDLDHKSANVQKCVKAYEDFLVNDLGYVGFRYDMVKGFAGSHIGDYNSAAGVKYSVGENWSGNSTIQNWIKATRVDANGDGVINNEDDPMSAAFDFQFRYRVRDAINNSDWTKLSAASEGTDGKPLIFNSSYRQYAVTFVENHDMETRSNGEKQDPIAADTLAANAYMMAMPGTPCVFFKHWINCKKDIKKMIAARKLMGINNQSAYTNLASKTAYYANEVTGTNGKMIVVVGSAPESYTNSSYKTLLSGKGFRYLVPSSFDTSSWQATVAHIESTTTEDKVTLPSCATWQDGTFAYFEAPTSWGTSIHVWAWTGSTNYYSSWPGDAASVSYVGTNDGKKVYLWKYAGTKDAPAKIIFNDTKNQTADLTFINGGYYTMADGCIGVVTAPVYGDVNGDGNVDINDVNAVISVICGDETYADTADVNGSGTVDINDVNEVISVICGK